MKCKNTVPKDLRAPFLRIVFSVTATSIALFCTLPSAARAQYTPFGKNKVQYSDFHWRVLESRHFHLYFYKEEADLANQALEMAEASYTILRARFVHDVTRPIPLIVYNSHQDFEQTNVTPYFLPEGVAGLTEFAKGRVLIPFDGSLPAFRITIQHELVHVFQLSMEEHVFHEHFRSAPLVPPSWFTEGLAVHWSEPRDTEADMVLRDMVISGSLPSIDNFWRYDGSFTVYKLGQSVCDYIGQHYGEDRLRLFYERIWAWQRFEDVIRDVLGVTQNELSERWAYELRQRYYPAVAEASPVSLSSRTLTSQGGADFKPLPLPDSLPGYPHSFVFLSPRNGFTNIYTASLEGQSGERDVHSLVEGERRPEFENFHAFRSRMDVSRDGILLFVSKNKGQDEILLYSIPRREVIEQHGFPRLVGLTSPGWVGGTDRFVFSGLSKDGYSDLYLYDRRQQRLTRLTSDRYQDLDPSYCSWLDAIVFSSDRTPGGDCGARNLFLLDLKTGGIRYLTRGRWRDSTPIADPEHKKIDFVSDRDGFANIYQVDESGNGHRLTRSLDAIFDPRPIPGRNRFIASVFHRGNFHARSFAISDTTGPLVQLAPADTTFPWDWHSVASPVASREEDYHAHYTLDVAQGGVLSDPTMHAGEGMQAAFSDIMGNHVIALGFGNNSFSSSDFLKNFSASATYVNLTRRLNWGVTGFHYSGNFYDELDNPYYERRSGAGVLLRYPLSKFERLETNLSLAYSETDHPFNSFHRSGPIATHSVSFVHDTSLWDANGPIDGQCFNLTAATTLNLRKGSAENSVLWADLREYKRLGLLSTYAVRLQGGWSEGPNPELFLLGGSHSLRSWDSDEFFGKRTLLLNQEIRFPLVRGMTLGLPIGTMELPGIQGAIFFDAGSAWDNGWPPPWEGSYGVGLRMGLGGYMVLRLDAGRRTDFHTWSGTTDTSFSIGWDY